jgi:nitrite reductase (NADH) large subunit
MKIIVVGHGMVGHKFLEELHQLASVPTEVTVLCEEPRAAYDRVHLSEFFAGKTAEDLSLVEPGFFEQERLQAAPGKTRQRPSTAARRPSPPPMAR